MIATSPFFFAVAFTEMVSLVGQFLLASLIAFVALCAIVSGVRYYNMSKQAASARPGDMDPKDAFQVHISQRLASIPRSIEPFSVALFSLSGNPELRGASVVEMAQEHLEEAVRDVTREGEDWVGRVDEARLGLIIERPRRSCQPIVERALAAVGRQPCRISGDLTLDLDPRAGMVSCPENGERLRDLIEGAGEALSSAEAMGSTGAFFVMPPLPGIAEDLQSDAEEAGPAPRQRQDVTDELTGVLRQERLLPALQRYIASVRKVGGHVSLLYMDVDDLARYREHYGEDACNEILRGLGSLLQEHVREEDLIARCEGAEFVIAMACRPKKAMVASQRLVKCVKRSSFLFEGRELRISVSIGVSGYPDHARVPRKMLAASYAALHAARNKGRGVALVYQPTMQAPMKSQDVQDVF